MDGATTTQVTIWVLIDADGRAVSDCHASHLKDEWEADHDGPLDPATPTRVVKLTLALALPRPIEVTGSVPAEACAGAEVRAA